MRKLLAGAALAAGLAAGTPVQGQVVAQAVEQHAWTPQPGPQTAAILCPIEDLFYGGQRGGGKTDYLLGDFASQASKYGEQAHGILFRRTLPQLDEVVKRSKQIYKKLGWNYNEQKKTWTSPEGATLKFRYLDRDEDADEYQGHQYTWMGFDEVGTWPSPAPLDELWACLRSAAGVPCVRRLTGNPGGVGHHWLKQRYILPAPPMQPHRWQPQPETHPDLWVTSVFIPARLEDNQLLMRNDPGYEGRIAAATKGNKALWQAWRYGNWDVVAGAAFDEWNEDLHVLAEFYPPPGWTMLGGMDGGVRHHSWLGLAVKGPEHDVVVTHEWYWKDKDFYTAGYDVGFKMKLMRRDQLPEDIRWNDVAIWADSSMFVDAGVGGLTQASEFQRGLADAMGGLEFCPKLVSAGPIKTKGSRHAGVALVRQMLHWEAREDGTVPPHKRPLLRIHRRCENLIRTLPALPIDPDDIEDVDTEAEDHPFDGLKYLLLANMPAPTKEQHQTHDENRHPGIDALGRRGRPTKPLLEKQRERELEQWQREVESGGFGYQSGYRYGGEMEEL